MPASQSRRRARAFTTRASERTSLRDRPALLRRNLARFSVASILAGLLVPVALVAAAPAASAANSASATVQFNYTGNVQHWTIPAGVTQLVVDSYGAQGAAGQKGPVYSGGSGGHGAHVQSFVDVGTGATAPFQPGDTLDIYAGGAGGDTQLAAFPGGSGGSGSCGSLICISRSGDGGQGGGGSGVADLSTGNWINIANGGGGGGGADNAIFELYSTGSGGSDLTDGATACTPPDILSPSNGGGGTSGGNSLGGDGGGGGGGGGCPGGAGGSAGAPSTGGSAGDYWIRPGTAGFNPSNAGSGDGSVSIKYFYTPPTLTTTPSAASASAGSTLTDTATLSGLSDQPGLGPVLGAPGGTITFRLYYNGGTSPVDTEPVAVTGNGSYTTPKGYVATAPGSYQWTADYSGDTFNGGTWNEPVTDDNDPGEVVTVSAAQPALSVTPAASSVQLGDAAQTLTATATLSGGSSPTGTITFSLYYFQIPAVANLVDTEKVTVSGNGNYKTPTGYALPSTGTVTGHYDWEASYTGDGNNDAAFYPATLHLPGEGGAGVAVTAASPSLATTPSAKEGTFDAVSPLKDTATLSGGYNLTGTITFALYYNGGSTPVDTETEIVTGNGSYTTPTGYALPTSSTAVGDYQWVTTYDGDGNNNAASDSSSSEQTTVDPASVVPTVTLGSPNPAVTYGSESGESFSGTVSGPSGDGTPQGSVRVTYGNGGLTLCTSQLTSAGSDSAAYSCNPSDFQLPAGGYGNLAVFYAPATASSSNANYSYVGGSLPTSDSFTVNPAQAGTSTTLTVASPQVSYGSENGETFSGTVAGLTGYGTPQGVVAIMSGTTTLCTAPLSAAPSDTATYACALTNVQLDTGTYSNVRAVYQPSTASSSDPSVSYTPSNSTTASFTVNPATVPSTTTLNVSSATVTYGSEGTETLSGRVSGPTGDGTPQGSVQITAGTSTVCNNPLTPISANSATYSCTLTATQLQAANYNVQATYQPATMSSTNPDYSFAGSNATGSFTVAKATPSISWSNPGNIVFGTLLGSTQLNATASVPGTFSYSPAKGTLLPPGNGQALQVTFTPTDGTDYTNASATVHINVTSLACVSSASPGGLTVGAGQAGCVKTGGTVNGAVTVKSGGAFYMNGGTIKGSVTVSGATAVWMCGVTISGGLTITGSTGPVLVGGPGCTNLIQNPVSITGNTGGVTYLGNKVKGSVTITGNSGGFNYSASANSATGTVTVSNNT